MSRDEIKLAACSAYYYGIQSGDNELISYDDYVINILEEHHVNFEDDDLDEIFRYAEDNLF